MKKALVILLALTMVMSMFAMVPASAADEELAVGQVAADYKPEGEAIKTADDFYNMKADGKYYLDADITIDETYVEDFVGTFDGNGKTITTTVPVFAGLDGTVKNLTIDGKIVITVAPDLYKAEGYAGALANIAGQYGEANITNVVNKASLSSAVAAVAGLVGMIMNDTEFNVTFTDCANYGSIVCSLNDTAQDSGGIAGQYEGGGNVDTQYLKFINCSNYGVINASGRPGGIIGYANASTYFEGCYNAGMIQSTHNYCGGIVGRCGTNAGSEYTYTFIDCVNDGDVSVYQSQGAGFVGYSGGCKSYEFKNCVNNGNVYAGDRGAIENIDLAGFIGNVRQSGSDFVDTIVFENCVNNGDIGQKDLVSAHDGNARYCAGFVNKARVEKSITMINCVNNGNIYAGNVNQGGGYGGGLYSMILFKNKTNDGATFTNCINNGFIHGHTRGAGLVGSFGDEDQYGNATFYACGNTGDIKTQTNNAGGLVGYTYGTQYEGADFLYCFNTGDVHSAANYAGGILAYSNDYAVTTNIMHCYSAGKVTSGAALAGEFSAAVADQAVKAGSTYSFVNSIGETKYFVAPAAGKVTISGDVVTFVANAAYSFTDQEVANGDTLAAAKRYGYTDSNGQKWAFMTSSAVSGIVSIQEVAGKAPIITVGEYVLHTVEWNVTDNTTAVLPQLDGNPKATALTWNNKGQQDFTTNIVLKDATPVAYVAGCGASWIGYYSNEGVIVADEADFTSGKIAYDINTAAGEDIFYQNLNGDLFVVDAYPTTDSAHAKVVYLNGQYQNQLFDMTNDSGSPATGDAIVYVVVALAVSTISLAAVAVCKKIKEN